MRSTSHAHRRNIISADYAHNLDLIVTGGRDKKVRIWDYERMKFIDEILAHRVEVSIVKFLKPFPLLLTSDNSGVMYIWLIPPHPLGQVCIVRWVNKHSMKVDVPISSVDTFYDEAE